MQVLCFGNGDVRKALPFPADSQPSWLGEKAKLKLKCELELLSQLLKPRVPPLSQSSRGLASAGSAGNLNLSFTVTPGPRPFSPWLPLLSAHDPAPVCSANFSESRGSAWHSVLTLGVSKPRLRNRAGGGLRRCWEAGTWDASSRDAICCGRTWAQADLGRSPSHRLSSARDPAARACLVPRGPTRRPTRP